MAKKTEQPSKAEMVRQALAAGKDVPEAGVAWIKATSGIYIDKPMFSSYKSQEKARQEKKAATPAAPSRPSTVPKVKATVRPLANGNSANLARQIKALVGQYGAEAVKDMATVFAE